MPRRAQESALALATRVRQWVGHQRVIGAELMIVEGGKLVVHEASGWSDREQQRPLQVDSLYRVRSMTKPLVGVAIFMLAEAGELGLDDAVADHLPAWDNERSREITLRQLLGHVGGFEQGAWPRPLRSYATLRAAVDAVGEQGPAHAPGSSYHYSDIDGATLGAIIAERTRMPVERFLSERICEPLGMSSSYFAHRPDAPWAERVNPTYRWIPGGGGFEKYWEPSMAQVVPFFRAAGGLYCSVRDYARFVQLWLGEGQWRGRRLISRASVRAALEPGPFGRYGMFWDLPTRARAGERPWAFGHVGTDGTAVIVVPERELIALYFTQSRGRSLMYSFANRFGDAFDVPGPMPKWTMALDESGLEPAQPGAAELEALLGCYEFGDPDKRLVVRRERGPSHQGTFVIHTWLRGDEHHLIPLGGRRFALGWVRGGERIELRCDEDVRLVFSPAQGPVERVEIRRGEDVRATGARRDSCA